ncbi:hypothetical protein F511_35697 [Dorcoceras hygrometricum]|uniref:Uncharacterized protein n=1 Tax=Dorcoceras hygrometricum TaxID=472368 RepID=A0A2Z7DCB2_9LAMI|nr:hypothetical protein F511_35697 [Dorcoceras hygrometricum]
MHPRLVNYITEALVWMYYSCLLVIPSQRASAESLARRQNAVVSNYSNDIVLLSLTSSTNCCFLLIVMSLLMSSLLSSPAGLLAPADLSSSADHDVVTDDIIIDAGSTWPPPDYEQLTQLWTSSLLIQLPFTMINQTSCELCLFKPSTGQILLLFIFFFDPKICTLSRIVRNTITGFV